MSESSESLAGEGNGYGPSPDGGDNGSGPSESSSGDDPSRRARRRKIGITVGAVAFVAEVVWLWQRGYGLGGNVIVRCRAGHLFTTIWLPGISLKSLRLGFWRVQYCPVGKHWSLVIPAKRDGLTAAELGAAGEQRDLRIP